MSGTIVAPATPSGRGGIGIIRVSGKMALDLGVSVCGKHLKPRILTNCNILNSNSVVVDSGLAVYFKGPESYTGEDVVEVHCHGSPVLMDAILESFISLGARLALPGEFTERAYMNNKLDLAQAESVADLISAESSEAAKAALSSLKGEFSSAINSVIDNIVSVRLHVEANLDFPDEELGETFSQDVIELLQKTRNDISGLIVSSKSGAVLREGAKVAIVGPPNSGKSTLVNALSGEDLSIVSDIPGTTRDPIRTKINLSGFILEIVDTAGLRKLPQNPIEEEGIKRTKKELLDSNVVLHACAADSESSNKRKFDENTIELVTKCDLDKRGRVGFVDGVLYVSAKEGLGLNELKGLLLKKLGVTNSSQIPILARRRHLTCLEFSLASIDLSLDLIRRAAGLELVSESLKDAQVKLGEITRPISADELLGEIFSSFCIGK